MLIKKAVFPVAGLGSRFLPATKANPKEMLPVVDKPLIQYAVEEAVRAGFTHMIFITSSSKRAIEDHFDRNFELEARLSEREQFELLELVQNISPETVQFTYIRQNQPQGLGHAILCAEQVIGQDPFAVLLADDLLDDSRHPCLQTMVDHFTKKQESIIAAQAVSWQDVQHYGIVSLDDNLAEISALRMIVEKPDYQSAPSNLAIIGRYIFTPSIFAALRKTIKDKYNELQLSDGIAHLLEHEEVNVFQFSGKRYDCGSKLGYLQAIVAFARQHQEVGAEFERFIAESQSF